MTVWWLGFWILAGLLVIFGLAVLYAIVEAWVEISIARAKRRPPRT